MKLRRASTPVVLGLGLLGLSLLPGCGSPPPADVTERLWVSSMPSGARDSVNAFVITEVRKKQVGVFYTGSVYRGTHDAFSWTPNRKKDGGKLKMLQDGRAYEVTVNSCEPSKGFDHCMLLQGDPTGVVRYESRKRWALKKGRKKKAADVPTLVMELSAEDDDLEALIEEAYE